MGQGIDWMIAIALWVTSLPGAVGRIHAFGVGPLLLGTAGLLLICLLRTPLRWSGAIIALAACAWAFATPRPDILIATDGQAAAIRANSGRLSVLHSGRDTFAIKEWLAADGDARTPKDATLRDGVLCDEIGCVGKLRNGRLVAFALSTEALAEDCARAAMVVSSRDAQRECSAMLIDRKAWRANGAMALLWTGEKVEISAARPSGYDRPWARAPKSEIESTATPIRPAARDGTPRTEDLEPGDVQ